MYANGNGLFESCSLANLAAGLSVEKVGTVSISLNDIKSYKKGLVSSPKFFLNAEDVLKHGDLVVGSDSSPTVVFTNGCFDVIHAGHVSYLSAAKKLGDLLIIGINDDESVRRLKGPARPVNTLENRAKVLAAMSFVDYIIPFSDDTPIKLIELISPDVLVKGGDYIAEEIVGYNFVTSNGGSVKVLPHVDGLSSSATIAKINNNLD
jgi:D-beta-D-heptose 7-phosphate kinase/D-beta-D-heptose 1-phosphate adenosyltransferase